MKVLCTSLSAALAALALAEPTSALMWQLQSACEPDQVCLVFTGYASIGGCEAGDPASVAGSMSAAATGECVEDGSSGQYLVAGCSASGVPALLVGCDSTCSKCEGSVEVGEPCSSSESIFLTSSGNLNCSEYSGAAVGSTLEVQAPDTECDLADTSCLGIRYFNAASNCSAGEEMLLAVQPVIADGLCHTHAAWGDRVQAGCTSDGRIAINVNCDDSCSCGSQLLASTADACEPLLVGGTASPPAFMTATSFDCGAYSGPFLDAVPEISPPQACNPQDTSSCITLQRFEDGAACGNGDSPAAESNMLATGICEVDIEASSAVPLGGDPIFHQVGCTADGMLVVRLLCDSSCACAEQIILQPPTCAATRLTSGTMAFFAVLPTFDCSMYAGPVLDVAVQAPGADDDSPGGAYLSMCEQQDEHCMAVSFLDDPSSCEPDSAPSEGRHLIVADGSCFADPTGEGDATTYMRAGCTVNGHAFFRAGCAAGDCVSCQFAAVWHSPPCRVMNASDGSQGVVRVDGFDCGAYSGPLFSDDGSTIVGSGGDDDAEDGEDMLCDREDELCMGIDLFESEDLCAADETEPSARFNFLADGQCFQDNHGIFMQAGCTADGYPIVRGLCSSDCSSCGEVRTWPSDNACMDMDAGDDGQMHARVADFSCSDYAGLIVDANGTAPVTSPGTSPACDVGDPGCLRMEVYMSKAACESGSDPAASNAMVANGSCLRTDADVVQAGCTSEGVPVVRGMCDDACGVCEMVVAWVEPCMLVYQDDDGNTAFAKVANFSCDTYPGPLLTVDAGNDGSGGGGDDDDGSADGGGDSGSDGGAGEDVVPVACSGVESCLLSADAFFDALLNETDADAACELQAEGLAAVAACFNDDCVAAAGVQAACRKVDEYFQRVSLFLSASIEGYQCATPECPFTIDEDTTDSTTAGAAAPLASAMAALLAIGVHNEL